MKFSYHSIKNLISLRLRSDGYSSAQTQKARIRCIQCSDGVELNSSGDWIVEELAEAAEILGRFSKKISNMPVKWNVADMERVDS